MLSVTHLRSRYSALCAKLGATRSFQTAPQHDGSVHVEVTVDAYHYVVTERGTEFERRRTTDPDELLFWLMSDVTFNLASEYELKHRISGRDFRRLLFQKQIDLMGQLNAEWSERKRHEIQRVLAAHPYDDIACG
jgi:hypothetical protein